MTEVNQATAEANEVAVEHRTFAPMTVKSYGAIAALIKGEVETITIGAPSATVEGEEDEQQNINAYVIFQHTDEENGVLETLHFVTDQNAEGDVAGTGIVFGGAVEVTDTVPCSETVVNEDGSSSYVVDLKQFSLGLTNIALQGAFAQLGEALDLTIDIDAVSIFAAPEEGERSVLAVYASVAVTKEQLAKLAELASSGAEAKAGVMVVDIGKMLVEFNLNESINRFTRELVEQYHVDKMSASILRFNSINTASYFARNLTYGVIRDAVRVNEAAAMVAPSVAAEVTGGEDAAPVAAEAQSVV